MASPVVLGLLLICVASVCGSTPVPENSVSLLWAQTFERIADMPKKGQMVTLNPWLFLHRMSMYRLMIAATDPMMGCMGQNKTDSPFWGLPLQLAYIRNSERVSDPTGNTKCGVQTEEPLCISPKSWWSCENYFTSVLPFLSAAKQGLFGEGLKVEMERPAGAEEYCNSYTDCSAKYSEAMKKWDAFFQGLKASTTSSQPDIEKKDHILGLFWDALMASKSSASACRPKQSYYSYEEGNFTENWLKSAEYVSAARFQLNLQNGALFVTPMPRRILKAGDVAPNIADMTEEENHALSTFSWMETVNSVLGGRLVSLWKRNMCSINTRQKGQELLRQLTLDPKLSTSTFVSKMTEMTRECWF